MSMEYQPVIGIEVHVELATASKMFCACANDPFGLGANEAVCPTCLGLPGALPKINREALLLGIRAALALHSEVANICQFERKNYPYPDLVKGYQLSQYELPIGLGGYVTIYDDEERARRVQLRRVHLEEDTAKLLHGKLVKGSSQSSLDCNRSGVPLLEIVTEPTIHSAADAERYLRQLRNIMVHNGLSRCRMERGEMRLEVNVSVRPGGSSELGNRVEIKNQSSFRFVRDALAYEIERQIELLERGEPIEQTTRGWDPEARRTFVQRTKEEAHDYRYLPDPDLPPITIEPAWVEHQEKKMPEPLESFREALVAAGVSPEDVRAMMENETVGFLFKVRQLYPEGVKQASKWLVREVFALIKERKVPIDDSALTAEEFARVVQMLDEGRLNAKGATTVVAELFVKGGSAEAIVKRERLVQISDVDDLARLVREVLAEREDLVAQFRAGKTKVRQALFGTVMQKTRGRANPQTVGALLDERLG